MLPLGELGPYPDVGPGPRHTRLTPAEQRTQLSLWAIARSPLILGANLTLLDQDTLRLLSNSEVLKIDQHSTSSRQVLSEAGLVGWTADLPEGRHALALFNLSDGSLAVDHPLTDFGLPGGFHSVHDVWNRSGSKSDTRVQTKLDPHACLVLMVE